MDKKWLFTNNIKNGYRWHPMTKEHYDLMEQFEKDFGPMRYDKEPKPMAKRNYLSRRKCQ
jgi:hypothetical protein